MQAESAAYVVRKHNKSQGAIKSNEHSRLVLGYRPGFTDSALDNVTNGRAANRDHGRLISS